MNLPSQPASSLTRARAEMNRMVGGLRSLGGPWDGIQIVATAKQIGVRDGRRIAGRFRVEKDDLIKGARYDDGVARVIFGVDVHLRTRITTSIPPFTRPTSR